MPKEKKPAKQKQQQQQQQNDTPTLNKSKSNEKKKKSKKTHSSAAASSSSAAATATNQTLNKQISHNKSLSEPGFIKTATLAPKSNEEVLASSSSSSSSAQPLPPERNLLEMASSSSLIEYTSTNNRNNISPVTPDLIMMNGGGGGVVGMRTGSRSNDKFHQLFPSVPLSETVVETYSCAYVKSLNLLHGVMFLTRNSICFYSKILTSENILILKLKHINSITKTMHALIFPTAIRIETQNSTYSFTSFRSRSNTLDKLTSLLNQFRQKEIEQSNRSSRLLSNELTPAHIRENSADDESISKNKLTSSNERMSVSQKSADSIQIIDYDNERNESNNNKSFESQNSINKSGDFFLTRNENNLNSESTTTTTIQKN